MEAHPWVSDLLNKVAVVRGPVVYCADFQLRKIKSSDANIPSTVSETPHHKLQV